MMLFSKTTRTAFFAVLFFLPIISLQAQTPNIEPVINLGAEQAPDSAYFLVSYQYKGRTGQPVWMKRSFLDSLGWISGSGSGKGWLKDSLNASSVIIDASGNTFQISDLGFFRFSDSDGIGVDYQLVLANAESLPVIFERIDAIDTSGIRLQNGRMLLYDSSGIYVLNELDQRPTLNLPAPDGYFPSYNAVSGVFDYVSVVATPVDSIVFSPDFSGDGSQSDPIAINPDSLKNIYGSDGIIPENRIVTVQSGNRLRFQDSGTGSAFTPLIDANNPVEIEGGNNSIYSGFAIDDQGNSGEILYVGTDDEGDVNFNYGTGSTKPSLATGGLRAKGSVSISSNGFSIPNFRFTTDSMDFNLGNSFPGTEAFLEDKRVNKRGILLRGFGEDANGDGGNYSPLKANSLITKGYVDAAVSTSANGIFDAANNGATTAVDEIFVPDDELFKMISTDGLFYRTVMSVTYNDAQLTAGGSFNSLFNPSFKWGLKATNALGRLGVFDSKNADATVEAFYMNTATGMQYKDLSQFPDGIGYDPADYSTYDDICDDCWIPRQMLDDSVSALITLINSKNWLGDRLADGNVEINEASSILTLDLRGYRNSSTITIPAQGSDIFALGNSNFVSGGNNFSHGNANIAGYDRLFVSPQTTATYNLQASSTGARIYENSDYNSQLSTSGADILNGSYNTVLSATTSKVDEVDKVVLIGNQARAYLNNSIVKGSTNDFTEGTIFQNIGASQKTEINFSKDFTLSSGLQQKLNVASIDLDTMKKAYTIEVVATVYVKNGGDQSIGNGEPASVKSIFTVTSDGTTAQEALFSTNSKPSWINQTNVFIGASDPLDISISGNEVTFQIDIGDQIGSNSDPTSFRCMLALTIHEIGTSF
jgi:hypothetical protein